MLTVEADVLTWKEFSIIIFIHEIVWNSRQAANWHSAITQQASKQVSQSVSYSVNSVLNCKRKFFNFSSILEINKNKTKKKKKKKKFWLLQIANKFHAEMMIIVITTMMMNIYWSFFFIFSLSHSVINSNCLHSSNSSPFRSFLFLHFTLLYFTPSICFAAFACHNKFCTPQMMKQLNSHQNWICLMWTIAVDCFLLCANILIISTVLEQAACIIEASSLSISQTLHSHILTYSSSASSTHCTTH